uniref:Putative conserved plasma membrane protein n=2 Tax=Ornithodoros turicata TaxID=34597 RepID=A0A2R5LC15_9ACAR
MATVKNGAQKVVSWARSLLRSGRDFVEDTCTRNQQKTDSAFLRLVGPFEAYLVSIQSLLIWERPYLSAVALVAVNCFFWFIVSCSRRFYSFAAILAAIIFMYKTWVNSIWPEIRVPPAEGEDTEQWTPVNPQVLSVPELNRYVTEWSESAKKWFSNIIALRKTHPGLFCTLACTMFTLTAVLGRMVSGVLIVYTLLMTVTLGPGIALYVVPETWYEQFDAIMSIASGKPPNSSVMEEESQGLASFPDGEDESDLDSFLPDLNLLPAAVQSKSGESMHFVAAHFREDSSESDSEDAFARGLTFSRPQKKSAEASKSRPLAVGPSRGGAAATKNGQGSRHPSQSSDIDINEYEIVDESDVST